MPEGTHVNTATTALLPVTPSHLSVVSLQLLPEIKLITASPVLPGDAAPRLRAAQRLSEPLKAFSGWLEVWPVAFPVWHFCYFQAIDAEAQALQICLRCKACSSLHVPMCLSASQRRKVCSFPP